MTNLLMSATDENTTARSYTDVRAQWKALAALRNITKEDIVALCIYRSMIHGEGKDGAISRLRKSFQPITNLVKLENGAAPFLQLDLALFLSRRSKFTTWLTEDEKNELIAIAKEIKIRGKDIL